MTNAVQSLKIDVTVSINMRLAHPVANSSRASRMPSARFVCSD